ncbi:DUF6461 domain-containing protein [Streptomyces sp. SA15]|uniref:DUF6461 domain-containing protein n=1 Tax=Streptomyces sp. SA15 TaxID=934019 RepID=UPI0015C9E249|nr:DUF6461 domain-containing protein [Streptomyces sp. SA15]
MHALGAGHGAFTTVGDWSLMVECNGYLGITPEAMVPLSRGHRVVSHFPPVPRA